MTAFAAEQSIQLTSTTASQTVTLPVGYTSMRVYNAAANTVWLKYSGQGTTPTAANPGSTFAAVMFVQPGATVDLQISVAGGALAYIADTAGGLLNISVSRGY
jgi:phage-related minor tail protein